MLKKSGIIEIIFIFQMKKNMYELYFTKDTLVFLSEPLEGSKRAEGAISRFMY